MLWIFIFPGWILFWGHLNSHYDCAAYTAAAFYNAGVVDSQTVKPKNLFVVGRGISSCITDYIFRCDSIIEAALTDHVGVWFERLKCPSEYGVFTFTTHDIVQIE